MLMAIILFNIVRIPNSLFECNYLKNEKVDVNFLSRLRNILQILNIFKKRMIVKANEFPNLQTVKNLLRDLSKKRRFGTRFDSQHVKASQILVKSPWECFYFVFSSFSLNLIWKMSQLVLGEIFLISVKTLAADGKYFVQDCENLQLPIQMQLSEK